MRKLGDVTLRDLLPPSLQSDPDAIAASQAISGHYHRLYQIAPAAMVFSNLDNLPESWLDELANDTHIDFYDRSLPVESKRNLVRQSIPMHRKKGTPWAVEELVRIVFGEGRVEEWFEYGGEPYHFRVYSANHLATPEDAKRFMAALASVKNLRSVLDDILILRTWGEVLQRDYLTWEGVLGLHTWQDALSMTWQDAKGKAWGSLLGDRTWGQIYSYVWEETK